MRNPLFGILILLFGFMAITAHGVEEWVSRFNGINNMDDVAWDIAVDDSGYIYVTGRTFGLMSSAYDYATVKYNSSGDSVWIQIYNGTGTSNDEALALAVDGSNNLYVTGRSYGLSSGPDMVTIKYNQTTGDSLWVRRYNGPGNFADAAWDIDVDDFGNVYVTGQSDGIGTMGDIATIKYNSIGDILWVRRYNGMVDSLDVANGLALDDSGNVYVTGFSTGGGTSYDFITIKYNSVGDTLWVRKYDGPGSGFDIAWDIDVDPSGDVYVIGSTDGIGTSFDFTTIKYNGSTGDTLWVRRHNGTGNTGDEARAISVDASGFAYVTGRTNGIGSGDDFTTIKYSSIGDTLWVRTYNGPGNGPDLANDIVIGPLGYVYITGWSPGSGSFGDYATIKYTGSGDTVWVSRYNGPGNSDDVANGIALDAFNNVYVTGTSWEGMSSNNDYATIKYCQLDRGTISITSPPDTIFSDSTYAIEGWVQNFGSTIVDTLDVVAMIIPIYSDTVQVLNLNPGDSTLVSFLPWTALPFDSFFYDMSICVAQDPCDEDTSDDCVQKTFFAYIPVGIQEENDEYRTPNIEFRLFQNNPNPFHSSTVIRYQIPSVHHASSIKNHVSLNVYDLSGRLVETLVDGAQEPGVYQVEWDGARIGSVVRSGIYFYRLTVGDNISTKKLIFLR
jgi:hypothetical protein